MNDGNPRILKLNCVSCGQVLDVPEVAQRLACSACGASQNVAKAGSSIYLTADSVSPQAAPATGGGQTVGSDASAHSRRELDEEKGRLAFHKENLQNTRVSLQKDRDLELAKLSKRFQTSAIVAAVGLAVGFLIIPLAYFVFYLLFIGVLLVIDFTVWTTKTKKTESEFSTKVAELERNTSSEMDRSRERISDLEAQLNRR